MGYFCADTVPPLVDYYGGLLVELGLDPRQPEACFRELYQRSLWWGRVGLGLSVLSGVEMALWDIAGKAAGRPVHELIGGPAHDRLPLYASGGTGAWPLERTVDQARRYTSLGFRGLKIGTGFEGRPGGFTTAPGRPAVRDLVRAAARPSGSPTSAASSARCARRSGRTSSSPRTATPSRSASRGRAGRHSTSPAPSSRSTCCSWRSRSATTTRPATRSCGQATRVPIAGGECLTGIDEFGRFLDAGAFDYVQPDATHVGGVGVTRDVARMAEERHVGLIVHTGAAVGPGFMANLHVAFASPNARFVEYALAPDNVRQRAADRADAPGRRVRRTTDRAGPRDHARPGVRRGAPVPRRRARIRVA